LWYFDVFSVVEKIGCKYILIYSKLLVGFACLKAVRIGGFPIDKKTNYTVLGMLIGTAIGG
jgi:MFS-type transporter involved in bile tolerance (Atg22 family)